VGEFLGRKTKKEGKDPVVGQGWGMNKETEPSGFSAFQGIKNIKHHHCQTQKKLNS
jgi:hypothetical protein